MWWNHISVKRAMLKKKNNLLVCNCLYWEVLIKVFNNLATVQFKKPIRKTVLISDQGCGIWDTPGHVARLSQHAMNDEQKRHWLYGTSASLGSWIWTFRQTCELSACSSDCATAGCCEWRSRRSSSRAASSSSSDSIGFDLQLTNGVTVL